MFCIQKNTDLVKKNKNVKGVLTFQWFRDFSCVRTAKVSEKCEAFNQAMIDVKSYDLLGELFIRKISQDHCQSSMCQSTVHHWCTLLLDHTILRETAENPQARFKHLQTLVWMLNIHSSSDSVKKNSNILKKKTSQQKIYFL